MQDTKLFETILGLTPPWHICRVELKWARRSESRPFAAQKVDHLRV